MNSISSDCKLVVSPVPSLKPVGMTTIFRVHGDQVKP